MRWTIALEGGPRTSLNAAVTIKNKIYSFGSNCNFRKSIDVYILNTFDLRWRVCDTQKSNSCVPLKRFGHTVIAHGSLIYLWGGCVKRRFCNKLFCFDTKTNSWSVPKVSGTIPDARICHSACVVDESMYIFGGYSTRSRYTSTHEIHALNLKTLTWEYICAEGPKPIYKYFYNVSVLNGLIYVWEGLKGALLDQYGSQIRIFDPLTKSWSLVATAGDVPISIESHSAAVYENELYLFESYNYTREDEETNDYNYVHKLDPDTNTWTKLVLLGTPPCRRRSQAFCLSGTKIYLFGGYIPQKDRSDCDEDIGDLHVLDLDPSLTTLAMLKVLKYNLDTSDLPRDIKWNMKMMTLPHTVYDPLPNAVSQTLPNPRSRPNNNKLQSTTFKFVFFKLPFCIGLLCMLLVVLFMH